MIKVLVVDDSAFMRKLISDFINGESDMTVLETARNGKDALLKLEKAAYDVVTLDIEMPEMNGIDALREIMKGTPLPVLMVSSLTTEGAQQTITAMEEGAVDFIAKPSGSISLDLHHVKDEILFKIRAAAGAKVEQVTSVSTRSPMHTEDRIGTASITAEKKILAIAASTGGPKALQKVLPLLPKDFAAPIFIVQHMPPTFTKSLAERLNHISSIHIKEAEDGEIAKKGTAYIAPGGSHLKVKKMGRSLIVEVTDSAPVNGHRPSADELFLSLSDIAGYGLVGVVLTGMGYDGAQGLKEMKNKQSCIAVTESAKTSVVYGMPKVAREKANSDYSLDLNDIADFLNNQIVWE
ncbi:chemotaxis response regulator protein-glutamate methylesterase [Salibacterium salarium]|uniref:Protein-glutamate methylesterase/protein-glutamine glutaminase n=1 Tax=Salibacterium salarium TaxID=284579 RepID=A0A428N4F0_9BACI|nr:chemotaxis response regulator protein-glutamate methylesterase [Salibacterium salarium]RSL33186.1 chemotaxis response regulator protein-glutamate methylesterase [Salibacterium salarium]